MSTTKFNDWLSEVKKKWLSQPGKEMGFLTPPISV